MPEPISPDYLRETQRLVAAVPAGPWNVEPNEYGLPDQVGPICFLETWADSERIPVVEFISHAREALPRYVGEVARLRNENKILRLRIEQLQQTDGGARDDR